jgi:DNA-binding NtrC family response regulator
VSRDWLHDPTKPLLGGTLIARDGTHATLAAHRLTLTATAGPASGQSWEIAANRVRIGTAPGNDVQLPDEAVSRHHCEIRSAGDGYIVRDLGSTNGTRLDGARIIEGWLDAPSRLQLGASELRFHACIERVDLADSRDEKFGAVFGRSTAMRALFGVLERVAPSRLGVVLVGETGTGKDLVARAIHETSDRARGPYVVVDCGAMSRTLIESDLFGHERGAFTGADRVRPGAFERAAGGTIFLDEIGELPLELQPKLLRALENGEVQRLGGTGLFDVDVRVVAATHRDLDAMVAAGEFRQDLYFRLAEIVVAIPPLRERRADIAPLARRLLAEWARETEARSFDEAACQVLSARGWPGNVRELRNVVRRAAVMAETPIIGADVLVRLDHMARGSSAAGAIEASTGSPPSTPVELCDHLGLREARQHWTETLERTYLEQMRARFGEDVDAMAQHMGVLRKSVLRLLRQHSFET